MGMTAFLKLLLVLYYWHHFADRRARVDVAAEAGAHLHQREHGHGTQAEVSSVIYVGATGLEI